MVKRRKPKRPTPHTVEYLLEQGTLQQMLEAKERTNALLKYYWDYYSELALQRSQIQEELKGKFLLVIEKYEVKSDSDTTIQDVNKNITELKSEMKKHLAAGAAHGGRCAAPGSAVGRGRGTPATPPGRRQVGEAPVHCQRR